MSDDEESPLVPSDPETQFVPQEDDDETLWEVIEITAEKGKLYKVRWKGIDPNTQKPWPQSWVAKHDCTDDLVRDWKLRQAKKKKASTQQSGKKSGASSVRSLGSGSTSKAAASPSRFDGTDLTHLSTSTATAVTARRSRSKAIIPSPSVRKKGTRSPLHTLPSSPLSSTRTSPSLGLSSSGNVNAASSTSAKTGAKRKHGETTSASATTSSRSTFPTTGVDKISGSVPPPRKKRKLDVELVNNYNEHSANSVEVDDKEKKRNFTSRVIASHDDNDYAGVKLNRNQSQPAEEGEEEAKEEAADERMVEESLSDIYCSSGPRSPQESSHSQEEEGTPTPPDRAQGPAAHTRQDTVEDGTPTVSRPQREMKRRMDSLPTVLATSSSKSDPPSKQNTCPSSPSSSCGPATESHTTMTDRIVGQVARSKTTPGENKRKNIITVSKQQWEELNDFQSQQVTERRIVLGRDKSEKSMSEEPPDMDYPVVQDLLPAEKSMSGQVSRSRAESAVGSLHSLSERGTKSIPPPIPRSKGVRSPGPSAAPSTSIVIPTGASDGEHNHRSPILSPGAKKRLKEFDQAMVMIELKMERKKERRIEDDAIRGKAQKSREKEQGKGGKMAVAGNNGRQEPEFVRASEQKSWKGKGKDQAKDDKAQGAPTPKPPAVEKKKKTEPLFLPNASDFEDGLAVRPKEQDHEKGKHRKQAEVARQKSKSGSKGRGEQCLPSHHEDQVADPAAVGASTSAGAGIEGSQSFEAELKVDNDIDMDTETGTGIVEQQLDSKHLRQEEEESTQDLMMELLHQQQQKIGVGQSGALVPEAINDTGDLPVIQVDSQPISELILNKDAQKRNAGNNGESDRSLDEIPSIIVENPSRASLARSHSSLEDEKPSSRLSKSRSRSPSVSSRKSRHEKEPDPEAEIPPTASTHRESLQALSQPADSQTDNAENPHHLGAAMRLLNIKSEEISNLEVQLSAEQRRNEALLQQLSSLRTEYTNSALSPTKTLEQELAEARAQLASQTASWENERAALVLNIEAATRSKISAEQDRDFFREQYGKASGFVSSVRDENAELEKQIKIATDQAQSGVSLIKSTFELRTKSLEEDVRAWRRMAEFLIEKDRRTNDDIRRRAAEEPELRARCDRQKGALEDTADRVLELEIDLEEKQRMLLEAEVAGKRWQEVTLKLNLELNEAKTKLERIGKIDIGDDDESAHPNGHEFVYRCQWRPDGSNDACEAVFLNISDLQEHLYSGGHLRLD